MLLAYVSMVKKGEIPLTQSGKEDNVGARRDFTEDKDPKNSEEVDEEENAGVIV